MKYFTPEWHHGDVEDADDHVFSEYQKHLAPLLPLWPHDVQTLATRVSLHDGRIRQLLLDAGEATLSLRLRCGDLQAGYFDLDLHYAEVLLSPLDWASLLTLNASKNSSALYDEVDEEGAGLVHRILFITSRRVRRSRRFRASRQVRMSRRGIVARAAKKFRYHEVGIRFQQLDLVMTPVKAVRQFEVKR